MIFLKLCGKLPNYVIYHVMINDDIYVTQVFLRLFDFVKKEGLYDND